MNNFSVYFFLFSYFSTDYEFYCSRKLVEALIQSLQGSARQSIDALSTFGKGVQDQVQLFQKKFLAEIDKVRSRIRQTIKNITGRVLSNGAAAAAGAIECVAVSGSALSR